MSIISQILREQTRYFLKTDLRLLQYKFIQKINLKQTNQIKKSALFLNVGCGSSGINSKDWCNIDAFPRTGVDLVCDASSRLPFTNNRFKGIYSEHFFEHLTSKQAMIFLSECLRVLIPNGILRLSVPDGELYLKNYFHNREWILARRNGKFRTPMEVINEVFRQNFEHHYCYDFETLSLWLKEAGFTDIVRVGFEDGSCPDLQVDKESRCFESMYIEAKKPV